MILIGIDDTDNAESKGTSQLAKVMARAVSVDWRCERIVRHQLLEDPRVPCTTRNGSASILLSPRVDSVSEDVQIVTLTHYCRETMKAWFAQGSDPGICLAQFPNITSDVIQFGYRCQFEIVTQDDAIQLANEAGIHLEGLGGTNGGIIGALAAVGLAAGGNDGRVVQIGEWFDDLSGTLPVSDILSRGVRIHNIDNDEVVHDGVVSLDNKLRPSLRGNELVLFVQKQSLPSTEHGYRAVRFQ